MNIIILAGGKGTRLRSVVSAVPKPMAPVNGKPFLEYLLRTLNPRLIESVTLAVGYKSEEIVRHFGCTYGSIPILYAHEDFPLGTGGAVRRAFENLDSLTALVLNGDTFIDLDIDTLVKASESEQPETIVATRVPDTSRYGRLTIEDGICTGIEEKGVGGPGYINSGAYILSREEILSLPSEKFLSLETDYLVERVASRPMRVIKNQGRFLDIGVPADYCKASMIL